MSALGNRIAGSAEKREELENRVNRLLVVRQNKVCVTCQSETSYKCHDKQRLAKERPYADDDELDHADADLYSDTSSIAPSAASRSRSGRSGTSSSRGSSKASVWLACTTRNQAQFFFI